jgi:MoxR-like ATPase
VTPDTRPLPTPDRILHGQSQVARVVQELRRVILGKDAIIDEVVAALLARGHVLLEGLPGLGKTELVKALSRLLSLDVRRIQFTPDLLPTDVTGSHILQEREGRREFVFHAGPIFTNLLLADEINRASPKTQAALLEAMQERRVTTFGETRPLPAPFFVLATQNPIELEGTYPLPEAQLDRFMFKVDIAGVDADVLEEILVTRVHGEPPPLSPVLGAGDLEELFALVDAIHLPRGVANYIARLVAASHPGAPDAPEAVRTFVKYGSSPRAAISIGAAARGVALLHGKPNVGFDDVRRVAAPAMAHRLVLDYAARLEGWDGRRVVAALLEAIPEIERGLPETLEAR